LFYKGVYGNDMWYDPVFLVNTVYARHVVQKALGRFLSLSVDDAIKGKLK